MVTGPVCHRSPWVRAVLAWLALAAVPAPAADPLDEPARQLPLAAKALLLDVTHANGRLIAVGAHGVVVLSDDQGRSWRQGRVPVRSTLTAVSAAGADAVAVGHDAVVLHSADAGASWQRVFADPDAAAPLLDVWLAPDGRGLAVGAYGLMLATNDGGRSWQRRHLELPADAAREMADDTGIAADELHLNAIAAGPDGALYLAAEAGHLFRSVDGGAHWSLLPSPYHGSWFALAVVGEGTLLAGGLRGHLYRSVDGGTHWQALATGTDALLHDIAATGRRRLVVVGTGGAVLASADGGRSFVLRQRADRLGLAAAVGAGGRVVAVGEEGVHEVALGGAP